MAGRPPGAQNKDKPFREALRMELAATGDDHKTLRLIALNLIAQSLKDEPSAMPAIREIGDRLDGKPAQAIKNDEDEAFKVALQTLERHIVDPADKGSDR